MNRKSLKNLNDVICSTIRRLRIENGLSQEELAHMADIDRSYLSGIERKRRNITISILEKLIPHLCKNNIAFLREIIKELSSE